MKCYGMHNKPGLPVGTFAMRAGPIMGSADEFKITIHGTGGHAALPHTTLDPVPVAAQIILAAQSIAARETDPLDSIVVSLTMLATDSGTPNIIPSSATLQGTVRSLRLETRDKTIVRLRSPCGRDRSWKRPVGRTGRKIRLPRHC